MSQIEIKVNFVIEYSFKFQELNLVVVVQVQHV